MCLHQVVCRNTGRNWNPRRWGESDAYLTLRWQLEWFRITIGSVSSQFNVSLIWVAKSQWKTVSVKHYFWREESWGRWNWGLSAYLLLTFLLGQISSGYYDANCDINWDMIHPNFGVVGLYVYACRNLVKQQNSPNTNFSRITWW